jgi:hypothetical protein
LATILKLHPNETQTISHTLREYIDHLPDKRRKAVRKILDLFESSMNNYAYQSLSKKEAQYFDEEYDKGRQFCTLFGPEKIPENVGEFLGYFLSRKVMGAITLKTKAPKVIHDLLMWLLEQKLVTKNQDFDIALEKVSSARIELPLAEKLSRLLHEHISCLPPALASSIDDEDILESTFEIKRVEGGRIWLSDGEGANPEPLAVSVPAALAAPFKKAVGFAVWLQLGYVKKRGQWVLLEAGSVMPP